MAHVIAEPCISTCETACTKVCPVDCIAGPMSPAEIARVPPEERASRLQGVRMYIDPECCTSCGACAPECPVEAIFDEDELPDAWRHHRELNARFFEVR